MSGIYLGQIGVFGFSFAPLGWAFCNGQTLAIAQNTALFSILGTTYGGNGTTTFQLPNLQSRVPIHFGTSGFGTVNLGEVGGVENVTLLTSQMPAHSHQFQATDHLAGEFVGSSNSVFGQADTGPSPGTAANAFAPPPANVVLNPGTIGTAGGNLPHNNIQPVLCVNFCIALQGVFPTRN